MSVKVRFGAVTNRETWIERIEVSDESGVPLELTGADVRLEVHYQPDGGRVLGATSGDGRLSAGSTGIITWRFEVEQMRDLRPGLYNIGLVCRLDGITRQVLTGTVEIEDGYLTLCR